MSAFMERAPELMERTGMGAAEPPAPPEDPEAASPPTEDLAERVTDGELAAGDREAAGQAIHWGYGAAWGAYFAVIQSTFRPPSIIHGLFLGGLMTAVAVKLVPQLGLAPEPRTREQLITAAASHGVFGMVTAVVYRVLNLGRRG
jgi:putative membrane protein